MSVKEIQQKISLLEKQIAQNQGNIDEMKMQLERLKFLAFEEEFREDDNRQLLQGQCCKNTTVGKVVLAMVWSLCQDYIMAYEILQEVSQWDADYKCNHTYLLNGDKIVAYIKQGDTEVNILNHQMRIDKRYRKFIKVKNTALSILIPKQDNIIKKDNVRVFNVKSKEKVYIVELDTVIDRYSCNCTGFTFRGKCKHIDAVKTKL